MTEQTGAAPDQVAWHALGADAVAARLASGPEGLDEAEASLRLARHGPNRLPAKAPRHPLRRLLAQLDNLLIHVLLGAAAVTALLGHAVDALVILGVVVLNALIGFVQEGRAERALSAIQGMLTPVASVVRGGTRRTVAAAELVPGDLVLLEAGDRVPADLRLLRARELRIDEAALTGESVPAAKAPEPVPAMAELGDRSPIAFSGTLVATGQGAGLVVATGAGSELGRIDSLLAEVRPLATPLLRQMDGFARRLTALILAAAALVFAFAVLVRGFPAEEAFMAVVGMAVAAIPEGLPAVLTITLALGVRRMAARHAIVRRLPAVETLGSVSVICSDKTGTLTRNEMTVRSVATATGLVEVSGSGYAPEGRFRLDGVEVDPAADPALAALARAALLCNDAALRRVGDGGWAVDGDPMEGALVALAIKAGLDPARLALELPRLDAIPFDARHRFMATLHPDRSGAAFACVKGAPERLLAMCDRQLGPEGEAGPLEAGRWTALVETLAAEGQRVLCLALLSLPPERGEGLAFADLDAGGLVLLGLVGLIDQPRPEAVAAVRDCRSAGIRVKMITGDHAVTAQAIARQLGLDGSRVVTGHELDRLDPVALRRVARDTDVFARTSPEHKLRLVEALQAEGAVVAMTGDGVNDAPALRRADVGIAMGRKGTEAAKEAAVVVLADDDFASIVAAVREGRTVHDNLQKVIAWTLPTSGGVALGIVLAILLGLTLPVTPVQILWINMVTAVALGLTLAFEPGEPDAMRRPPRAPDEPLLSRFLAWRVALVSLLMVAGTFGSFAWAIEAGRSLEQARTLAVDAIVAMEIAYLFSVRYLRLTSLTLEGVLGTRAVLLGVGAVVLLQLAVTRLPPMRDLLGTRPTPLLPDGLVVLGIGVALLALLEVEKLVRRRRRPC